MTQLRELIGAELRATRLAQGRTLRDVCGSANIALGYLSEIERGRKEASSELISAICAELGIRLSTLLAATSAAAIRCEQPTLQPVSSDQLAA